MNRVPQHTGFTPPIRANGGTFRRTHFPVYHRGVFLVYAGTHGIGLVSADSGRMASSQRRDFQQRWLCSLASIVVFFSLQIPVALLLLLRESLAGLLLAYAPAKDIFFAKECRRLQVALVAVDALRCRLWFLLCSPLLRWRGLQTDSLTGLAPRVMAGNDSAPVAQSRELITCGTKKIHTIPNGYVVVPGKRGIQMQKILFRLRLHDAGKGTSDSSATAMRNSHMAPLPGTSCFSAGAYPAGIPCRKAAWASLFLGNSENRFPSNDTVAAFLRWAHTFAVETGAERVVSLCLFQLIDDTRAPDPGDSGYGAGNGIHPSTQQNSFKKYGQKQDLWSGRNVFQ